MVSTALVDSMISAIYLTPQDDISKHNISNLHLHLGAGDYYLTSDLVLENIRYFSLTGTECTRVQHL